jgi:hypothetical protein
MTSTSGRIRASLAWEFRRPGDLQRDPDLAAKLSEFRGRELWAGGRRPKFGVGGTFADPHPADGASFHAIARRGGHIVGCVRATPLTHPATELRGVLGGEMRAMLVDAKRKPLMNGVCYEISRWVVDAHLRRTNLGLNLAAAAWAITLVEGWDFAACTAGTREGQAAMLLRAGAHAVPGIDLIPVPEYDDEVQVLYFDMKRPPPEHMALIQTFIDRYKVQQNGG